MAVITPPFVQQGGSHPAATFRQMMQVSFGSPFGAFAGGVGSTAAGGGHGINGPTDLAVTQNGSPNMSVNVAGGGGTIRGTESAHQGVYSFYNDATVNLVIAAADPTNPRRDLVVMKVRDAFYSGGSTDVSLAVVTGTPAGSPVDPTPPANALVIARVAVAAAVSSIVNANITDFRTRAASLGAVIPYAGSTFRPAGASLTEGLLAVDTVLNRLEIGNDTPALSSLISPAYGVLSTWTPNVTQGVSVTVTVTYARYIRLGRLVICFFSLAVTGAGTAGQPISVGTLPFAGFTSGLIVGSGEVVDASPAAKAEANIFLVTTSSIDFRSDSSTANDNRVGVVTMTTALAAGDSITGAFMYEAGSDA